MWSRRRRRDTVSCFTDLTAYYEDWERQLRSVLDHFYEVIGDNFARTEDELLARMFDLSERSKSVSAKDAAADERTRKLDRSELIVRESARRLASYKASMMEKVRYVQLVHCRIISSIHARAIFESYLVQQ